jgi:hypothetical protein
MNTRQALDCGAIFMQYAPLYLDRTFGEEL